jgi:glutamate-1-semialdehyde 2,1-aminomutase
LAGNARRGKGSTDVTASPAAAAAARSSSLVFWDVTSAMWAGLAALFLRQFGHAILEPPCHDKEETLLGYNTINKTIILGTYLVIPIVHLLAAPTWTAEGLRAVAATVAWHWLLWTAAVVLGRVVYLMWAHGGWLALVWLIKLVTDPVTDILAYSPRYVLRWRSGGSGPR